MTEAPALATLRAALPQLLDAHPAGAPILLLRAHAGLLADLPARAPIIAEQGLRPAVEALHAAGITNVRDGVAHADFVDPAPALVVVLPTRSRDETRALFARALTTVVTGGCVVAAALNDDGARTLEKDLAALVPLAGTVTKAHGRAFWSVPVAGNVNLVLANEWLSADAPRHDVTRDEWLRPGVFNEGRLDAGTALLIAHLPAGLHGAVADLGAGSGLLAKAVLAKCAGVTSIALFEAEARAIDLARRNLAGAAVPVAFHWHDVARGIPGRYDAIVCNPPFHVGSRGVPALGQAFITAAANALEADGQLLMVANRHLPYEETLRSRFRHGELLAETGAFKVYRAWAAQTR
jgi:16S rRNA (guanine1207-N2)-methyltransferase